MQKLIQESEDYIRCPKCGNSLSRFLMKNPDGIENATISRLLMIPEEQVEKVYEEAIEMLRKDMVNED